MAEGVGSLQLWHERLCHTCPQYKNIKDKGVVREMMLWKREHRTCDACHLSKPKRQTHWKKLDRATNEPTQVVYADLLIPGQSNATTIVSVLIIMDGCSNFITIKLLTSNNGKKVNHHMQEYTLCVEWQAGRYIRNCSYKVKQVLSDKCNEISTMRWRLGIARK